MRALFGRPAIDLPDLLEAVSAFATRAAEKLRKQDGRASKIKVFAHASPHRDGPRFSRSIVVPLVRPTADTRLLAEAAAAGMRAIYLPGFNLIKTGVILMNFVGPDVHQNELALKTRPHATIRNWPRARSSSGFPY